MKELLDSENLVLRSDFNYADFCCQNSTARQEQLQLWALTHPLSLFRALVVMMRGIIHLKASAPLL